MPRNVWKKPLCLVALAAFALGWGASGAMAQSDPQALQKLMEKIDQLEKRLAEQENKNAQLERQVQELKGVTAPAVPAQTQAPPQLQTQVPAKSAEKSFAFGKSSALEFYGYAKLDMAYDTGRATPGNYVLYLEPLAPNKNNNSQYNMTANQTRLGLNFTALDTGDQKVTGKIEMDFYGNGTANNKAAPLIRHAYMKVEWPKYDFSILAGQTSDIISPLVEPTINYTVGWDAGNIGYRRAQLRFDKAWAMTDSSKFDWQLGFTWNQGHSYTTPGGTLNSGVTSDAPTVQTRFGFIFPGAAERKVNLGFSGHYGREVFLAGELHQEAKRLSSYSYDFDASVPLSKKWTFQCEYFYGADLDQYFGGSNQAVDLKKEVGTISEGGWAAVSFQASPKWLVNFGGGADNPRVSMLETGARGNNASLFANVWYTFAKQAQVGFEVSRWSTSYVRKDTVKAMRYQLAFQYTF